MENGRLPVCQLWLSGGSLVLTLTAYYPFQPQPVQLVFLMRACFPGGILSSHSNHNGYILKFVHFRALKTPYIERRQQTFFCFLAR